MIYGLVVFLVTLVIILVHDYIYDFEFKGVVHYLNSSHHYHDLGHYLFEFFICTFVFMFTGNATIAFLSTILMVTMIEISQRTTLKNPDLYYDLYTHVAGGATAYFLLSA